MLQLNESNPSGIEAIIEAAGTVFCFFRPPLLFLVPFILSRAGGESVSLPFSFSLLQTYATINVASVTSAVSVRSPPSLLQPPRPR